MVDDDLVGATAVTGGWGPENEGSQASRVLRRVDLPVLSANQIRGFTKQLVTDNMIGTMTTGRDACAGDLGNGKRTCSAFRLAWKIIKIVTVIFAIGQAEH